MPFWLQEKEPIVSLRLIPTKTRVLYATTIILIITGCWLLLWALPMHTDTKKLQKLKQTLTHQHAIFSQALTHFDTIITRKDQEHAQYKEHIVHAPSKTQALDALLEAIKTCHLSCKMITPRAQKKKDFLRKEYLTATITGSFHNFIDFFTRLKNQKAAIKFKQCEFIRTNKTITLHAHIRLLALGQTKQKESV